jgi:hypothetical protein
MIIEILDLMQLRHSIYFMSFKFLVNLKITVMMSLFDYLVSAQLA